MKSSRGLVNKREIGTFRKPYAAYDMPIGTKYGSERILYLVKLNIVGTNGLSLQSCLYFQRPLTSSLKGVNFLSFQRRRNHIIFMTQQKNANIKY